MISKSNSVKYINSDYIHFTWAAFVNIYITQSIFLYNWKLIFLNTYSYAQFWNYHIVAQSDKVSQTVELNILTLIIFILYEQLLQTFISLNLFFYIIENQFF